MGTDKRERQKANRQLKLEEMAREARKRKTKKRGLQFGLGVPLLIVVVFLAIRLFGTDDTKSISAATTTSVVTVGTADISTTSGAPGRPLACPAADGSSAAVHKFPAAPSMCIDTTKKYTVTVTTSLGAYTAALDATKAPLTVNNFVYLARYHYFDNTPCHRIIPGFVIQCGDPTGTGSGNPGYSIKDELPKAGEYKLGSLAMANSGPDTNGSQFFVISGNDGIALPPSYSLFGQVTSGLDIVAKLDAVGSAGAGKPSTPVTINSVTVAES